MPMNENLKSRLTSLRARMKADGLDAFLVLDRANTRWLTGFVCSYSMLVVDGREARFITDGRYGEAAEKSLDGFKVFIQPTMDVEAFFKKMLSASGYKTVGFEETISVEQHDRARKFFKGAKFRGAGEILKDLRAVKDAGELKAIRKAVKLADSMMEVAYSALKPGRSEREVSREIRFAAETLGGERESFDNIVASGPNSSSPHHHPGPRRLRSGDPVTIDLGGVVDGYCSDLTRNPVLGKVSAKFARIYEVCLDANMAAIKACRAGITGVELDAVARDIIASAGFGQYFSHSLGHGVGLQVHEGPSLSPRAGDAKLQAGNIVTIEPGIYLPGVGGVRIEDYVLITEKGAQVLSKFPKDLRVIAS